MLRREVLQHGAQCLKLLLVVENLRERTAAILDFVIHLQDAHIVGHTHQVGDRCRQVFVHLGQCGIFANDVSQHQCLLQLIVDIGTEGYVLQPHHGTEVALQRLVAGIVATGAVDVIDECRHSLFRYIAQEFRIAGLSLIHVLDFLLDQCCIFCRYRQRLAGVQLVGNGIEGSIVGSSSLYCGIGGCGLQLSHQVVVALHEVSHHGRELLFLGFLQQTVEEHVEDLQIEVGCHETGELPVVVILVDVEQLFFLGRHNGKPVLGNGIVESLVEIGQLVGVDDVVHVDHHPCRSIVVLLLQCILACLQFVHERHFGRRILDRLGLAVLFLPEAVFHLFRVP